jgi:hypothetical protein
MKRQTLYTLITGLLLAAFSLPLQAQEATGSAQPETPQHPLSAVHAQLVLEHTGLKALNQNLNSDDMQVKKAVYRDLHSRYERRVDFLTQVLESPNQYGLAEGYGCRCLCLDSRRNTPCADGDTPCATGCVQVRE